MGNNPTLDDLFKQAEAKAQISVNTQPSINQEQPIQMQSRILKHSQEPMDLHSRMILERKTILSEISLDERTKSSKPTDPDEK